MTSDCQERIRKSWPCEIQRSGRGRQEEVPARTGESNAGCQARERSACLCLFVCCVTPPLIIFHSHGEVTFASEGPQNLGLYDWHLRIAIRAGFLSYHDAVTHMSSGICKKAVGVIRQQSTNRVPLFK